MGFDFLLSVLVSRSWELKPGVHGSQEMGDTESGIIDGDAESHRNDTKGRYEEPEVMVRRADKQVVLRIVANCRGGISSEGIEPVRCGRRTTLACSGQVSGEECQCHKDCGY